jgi:hypothetical protein
MADGAANASVQTIASASAIGSLDRIGILLVVAGMGLRAYISWQGI